MPKVNPFVRWAGGKTWFIPHFIELIGHTPIEHYFEPFLGGAAIFFSMSFDKKSYLSDINEELINAYIQIRNNPEAVISALKCFPNTEQDYYKIRSTVYENLVERAAQFIYLNQTSYNGIYRVSRSGNYNVPYGHRKDWNYNEERIREASIKLKNTHISHGDFTVNKYWIKQSDLVFLDPPYTVSHNNNGFIEYNKKLFSLEDQIRLSEFIDYVKSKKAYYILTNAHHAKIEEIFEKGDRKIIYERIKGTT